MLELSRFQHSHISGFSLSQSHTADKTSQRWEWKMVEKKRAGIVLVLLWMNWFSVYLNFHPRGNFCPSFTPSYKYISMLLFILSIFSLIPWSCISIFLSWIKLYPFLLSLHCLPAVGQCIFNLVSQTSLKARSSKEKFDISFHPIVSRLQCAALWLVDSQLIKPLVVWHPVLSSGRVTLLNEIN